MLGVVIVNYSKTDEVPAVGSSYHGILVSEGSLDVLPHFTVEQAVVSVRRLNKPANFDTTIVDHATNLVIFFELAVVELLVNLNSVILVRLPTVDDGNYFSVILVRLTVQRNSED